MNIVKALDENKRFGEKGHAEHGWSNKFDESPLVFTWLVIPLPKEEYSLILPVVGIVVAVATTFYARKIIQEDRINRQETHSEE